MNPAKKGAITSALIYSTLMSIYFSLHHTLLVGMSMGIAAGLFFGLVMFFFYRSRKGKIGLIIHIPNEENALYTGVANHFKNGEAVGGKMALFKNELYFKSHRFNIQNHELQIPLSTITEVNPYKIAGAFNTGLKIKTSDGSTEKFVVFNREDWQAAILAAKGLNA